MWHESIRQSGYGKWLILAAGVVACAVAGIDPAERILKDIMHSATSNE